MFTSVSVTGDSHTTAMSAFADAVKEFSGGSIECRTYADGTLFSSENEWDAISMGQADLAYISFPTLSTPPFGMVLFIVTGIGKTQMSKVIREILPMVAIMIVLLLLCTYIPQIIMFIPNTMSMG